MKIFVLLLISFLNFILWFTGVGSINDTIFLIPLLSLVISVVSIFPRIKGKRVEVKLLYFAFVGIIYFNAPLYFKSLYDSEEVLFILRQIRVSESYFIKSNILLGISLPLICLGYEVGIKSKQIFINQNRFNLRLPKLPKKFFGYLTILFLILSISITGFTVGGTYIGTSSYYYILLIRSVTIVSAILIFNTVIKEGIKKDIYFYLKENKFSFFVILFFLLYVLVGGDRGPALTILSILIFGFILINKMWLKTRHLFIGLFVVFLLSSIFTFVEVLRLMNNETLSLATLNDTLFSYKDYENVSGITIRCTSLAIEGIENNLYPHTYGIFFLQYLLQGIPFVGNAILENLMPVDSMLSKGSAHLLSIQYYGFNYTSGLGTSYLADIYIEFGVIGVIIISLFYGFMVGKFDKSLKNISVLSFASFLLILIFVGYSFYTGRSTLWSFLVNFFHTWILYSFVNVFFVKPFRK
ncbi:O-antigen polymerase [Sphingobacterium multivorum]|uniref:O-antigen polymerase n=1 Tax=Sphingobacterium multivorum TaxID=28454 RepID=UPI00367C4057